ncbi:MAG: hypothetical protein H5U25_15525 [Oceanibaculum nanhaiense]|nr:hypothetical protein [Oceanibaculum nanhaiense]
MQEAPELTTAADPASEAWRANEEAHRALVEELRGKLAAARLGGGEKARAGDGLTRVIFSTERGIGWASPVGK